MQLTKPKTMKNDFIYKWSRIFASKRYNTDGTITLSVEEQQELLDDAEALTKKPKQ